MAGYKNQSVRETHYLKVSDVAYFVCGGMWKV